MTQQPPAPAESRSNLWTLGLLGAVLVAGVLAFFSSPAQKLDREPPAPAAKPAPAKPAATATAPAKPKRETPAKPSQPLSDEKLVWQDPSEWKRRPASNMRYASYEVPAAKGDKLGGELNVFILTGEVEANIQRWVDEFSGFDVKTLVRSRRTLNGLPQAIVEIPKGHFNGGMGDTGPSPNYGLLGAIISAPVGNAYFFKLTAPSNTVKAARKPFYELLDSIRLEKPVASPASTKPADPAAAPPPAPRPPAPAGGAPHP